jgi:hypothetical protein
VGGSQLPDGGNQVGFDYDMLAASQVDLGFDQLERTGDIIAAILPLGDGYLGGHRVSLV